jgi:hypothetical protein
MVPNDAPRLVLELAAARLWLEQEVVVLDPRFAGELEAEIAAVVAAQDQA